MASTQNVESSLESLSGETLKAIVKNYLQTRGVDSHPAIDIKKKFSNCKNSLEIFPMFNSWSTVEILCPEPENGWKIMVRTRAQPYHPENYKSTDHIKDSKAIVVTKSLTKGHVIAEQDLEVTSVKRSVGTDIFKKKKNLIGRILRNNISAGFPIRARHLEPNWVIANGDEVDIVQSGSMITVTVRGMALQNGQKGERIKVKNLSSEKDLVAWVINEKKVTTNAKTIGN